jgi:hypothetical protein
MTRYKLGYLAPTDPKTTAAAGKKIDSWGLDRDVEEWCAIENHPRLLLATAFPGVLFSPARA